MADARPVHSVRSALKGRRKGVCCPPTNAGTVLIVGLWIEISYIYYPSTSKPQPNDYLFSYSFEESFLIYV